MALMSSLSLNHILLQLDNNYHNITLTNCICVNKLHGICINIFQGEPECPMLQ